LHWCEDEASGKARDERFLTNPQFFEEFAEGHVSIDSLSSRNWKDAANVVKVVLGMAKAVHAMHQSPVGACLHEDLKVNNIMVRESDMHVKVIDWDMCRLEGAESVQVEGRGKTMFCCDHRKGQFHLSPECQTCDAIDASTDVYALGQRAWTLVVQHLKQTPHATPETNKLSSQFSMYSQIEDSEEAVKKEHRVKKFTEIDSHSVIPAEIDLAIPGMREALFEMLKLRGPRISSLEVVVMLEEILAAL
jgi:serine/threonine protein kinase